MKKAMRKLRQKIADKIAVMQAEQAQVYVGDWGWMPVTSRGIQVGNMGAFNVVLKWIDETMEGKEIQKLRQKAAEALEEARAAGPATGMDLERKLTMGGIQIGSISMLKVVIDWIDEIAAGGKDEHRRDASGS